VVFFSRDLFIFFSFLVLEDLFPVYEIRVASVALIFFLLAEDADGAFNFIQRPFSDR